MEAIDKDKRKKFEKEVNKIILFFINFNKKLAISR